MKKTLAEPEIRPLKKIAIPEKLAWAHQKSINQHNFFNTLEQIPMISKKEILLEANGIDLKSNKQKSVRSRAKSIINSNQKKDTQIKVVNQFRALSRDNKEKKPVSGEKFKIKMTAAGFRRGKSVSNLRVNQSQKCFERNLKPQTSQQLPRGWSDLGKDNFDVIKAYYSFQSRKQETLKSKGQHIGTYQFRSEIILQKSNEQVNLKEVPERLYKKSVQFQNIKKVGIEQIQKERKLPEYSQLKQHFSSSDFEYECEPESQELKFISRGFGVTNDLSKYDIDSLSDPLGIKFLKNSVNKKAQCPYFNGQEYSWIKVIVVGYDQQNNKVIIRKQGEKQLRKVNRLSLMFNNQQKEYWRRINQAKKLRATILEEVKYIGYIDNRIQKSDMMQFLESEEIKALKSYQIQAKQAIVNSNKLSKFSKDKLKLIQKQCHNRYYKQFLVFYQMWKNYQPFERMGFHYRQFTPFKVQYRYQRFKDFKKNKEMLQIYHYCSVTNMVPSLKSIIEKIISQTQISFFHPFTSGNKCVNLEEFIKECKDLISSNIYKLIKQTREVLISDTIYKMRYSFGAEQRPVLKVSRGNNKNLEKRYLRLNNIIFRNEVQTYYFRKNQQALTDYLLKFLRQSKDKPNPIIHLEITINENKQFYSVPAQQQCYLKICSILQHLQGSMNKVPDLTSDLLYETEKYMKVSLKKSSHEYVKNVVQNSFKAINKYIESNNKYLKYLSAIHFNKQKFTQQAVKYYHSVLSQINQDLKRVLYYSLNKSGIFNISLEGSKKILKQQITLNKQRISRNIQKQAIEQSLNTIKLLSKMQEQLKVVPAEQVSYVRLKKYVSVDCQNLLDDCRINLQLIGKFYTLLEQFCYEYRKKQFDRYMQIVLDMALVQKKLIIKKLQLMDIEKRLLEKINQQREQIEKVIQESKQEIEVIVSFKKIDEYRDNFTSTSRLYYILQQNCKKLENINFRQELLQQQLSIFPMLNRQMRRIEPYYQMWKNVYYFKAQSREWYQLPIQQLNFEEIKLKVYETYKKQFTRLINIFKDNKNNDAQSICQSGYGLVQKLEQKFWMIESFTKEGLLKKPTMMNNILHKIYEADAPTNFKNVNLNDLVQHNVKECKQFIVETAEKAQKIWNLEKRINLVISEIKSLHLEIGEKFGVHYIQPEVLVSLIMASKEQISLLEVIKSQDEAIEIIKRITTVFSKVQTIQTTLQTVQQFQVKYIKIHRIFLVNEIINELGEEKKKINEVTRIWNVIIKHFNKDLQLWEAIDSDSHNHRLKDCVKVLQQIQQNLRKYLESKRIIFPRLFFISDQELIEMIADEKYQIKSNKMKLLFNGTTKFILKSSNDNKSCSIVGIEGSNRDSLKISRPVNSSIIIWDRLKQVHNEMTQTMQRNCNATGLTASNLLIIRMHHEVFKWTLKIEQRLRKAEKQPNYLHKLHESYYKQQMKMAGQTISQLKLKGDGEVYAWYCIKSVQLMLANILENLSKSSQNISTNSFEWQKCLRVYIEADKISPKIMTMILPISYEYVGCDLSDFVYLFASPITNLHTVVTLMRIYCGSNSLGGDCKQTIKSLSMITFSHFVQQNLHISHCTSELINKLRGYYVEPIFGFFNCKQSESLPLELISIIAQTAYQIRQAILLKEYAKVLAIDTKWDLNKGILNYGLHISFPLLNKNQDAGNSCGLLTLRLCFRDISLKKLPMNTFLKYFIQGLMGKQNYQKIVEKIYGIFESLIVKTQTGFNYEFKKLMTQILFKMLAQIKSNEQFSLQTFLQNLLNCLLAYLPHNFHFEIKQKISSLIINEQLENNITITKAFQYKPIQYDQQVSQFLEVVQTLQSSKGDLNMLAVVGPSLSGKTQLIRQALQRKGIQKQMIVQCASLKSYLTNSTEKLDHKYVILQSLYFDQSFESQQLENASFTNLVPSSAFLIFQCRSLLNIGPSPLKIYNKKQINNWHNVMWRLLKLNLSKYLPVIQQFSRQMGILARIIIYKLFGMSAKYHLSDTWMWEKNVEDTNAKNVNIVEEVWQIQSILIKIVKNWINATNSLLTQGKIIDSDLTSVREGILICMIWTAKYDIEKLIDLASRRSKKVNRVVIGENILVDLSLKKEQIMKKIIYEYLVNIQSTLLLKNDPNQSQLTIKKYNQMPNPYDFCYDFQKKAWLQWNVVDDLALYFQKTFQNFQQIYLPVIETASIIYLTQNISNHFDLILMSGGKGSGATTAIKKITEFHSTSKAKNQNKIVNKNQEHSRKEKRIKTQTGKKSSISQYFSSMACSAETISKMMDKIYVNRNKDGSYNAYKNSEVMIIVDDLEMISKREESGQKKLCEFLAVLTLFKTDMIKNKRLNNARNMFIATGVDYTLQNNHHLQRILNSTISIYMRPISEQSRISIFNYVLEWFFGNTDNPFSKEVRTVQKILVLLSVQLSNYHKQLYAQKSSILFKMRYADTNFKTLKIVFNYLCQVTPRWVKKQKEIMEAWVYQFNQVYPGLTWEDYLHIFDNVNVHIKKLPITRQQFIECVKTQVQKREEMKNLRLCVLKTYANNQYIGFSFQQAELYLLKTLADQKNNQSSRLREQLIFYPEFIRQIILDMRALMNEKNHMMKIDVRYGGRKTALKCAYLASTGNTNLGLIDFNSKIGWQKEIIKYLTSSFNENFQNNYYCLAFNINDVISADYLEVITEFLINCESKRLLCLNSKGKQKDDEEQKQPITILQHLKVHSFFSRKYQQFVEFCQKKLKIVIIIDRRKLNQVLNQNPVFLKTCSIININEEKYQVSGVINRSLGAVWNGTSPSNFLNLHNKDNTEIQKISKSISHVESQILSKLGFGNRKNKFIQWMSSSMHYFQVSKQKIQKQIDDIRKVMTRKQQIIVSMKKIQKELSLLIPKHAKVNKKNSSILIEVKSFEEIYLKKKRIFDDQAEVVAMKKKKVEDIQQQCEKDLGKVTPVLQSAEESLAKVTRDDINQLRSFPNPPLSAAKVVEALCFVFNEDHLVKQKVQNGVKFKDYWDYAKKFILNDRLLKRVTEFKPDYIKNMNKAKMEVLNVITKQPQLKEQRVFKASSAAGNLSVWMRAVVLTFEVMQIIEPKKKLLNQAIQDLKSNEQILGKMKEEMNEAQKQLIKISQFYHGQMAIEKEMQQKIEEIKSIIKRSQQFISLLQNMQREWENKINVTLPNEIQKCKKTCVIIGLHMTYLCELSDEQRKSSKLLIYQSLGMPNFELIHDSISQKYLSILLNTQGIYNVIAPNYSQNIVVSLQKIEKSQKNLIIYDQTSTLLAVILQFVDKYLKEMYSIVHIIDCLELNDQTTIYDRIQSLCKTNENKSMTEQSSMTKNRSTLIILLHVEQLTIHQIWEFSKEQFPNCRIVTIVRQQVENIKIQFDVVNELNQQTKQALINSVVYPIHKTNTMLNTAFNRHIHQQNVANHFRSMIQILSNNQDILLNGNRIHQWTSSYHSSWEGLKNEVTIKNMGHIQKQSIKMLSQSQYWTEYTTFSDFLNIIKATLERNQKQSVYSLNQKIKQKFQSSAKSLSNTNTRTTVKKQSHQIQHDQLGLPLRKRSQEEELFSFNPVTLIQLSSDEDSERSSNIILQFLQGRRAERANNGTPVQSNQIVYLPSKEKALLYLSYLIQNEKQVVICCDNKFQAYKIYGKIKFAYDQFCQKMYEKNDQFSCENYKFRGHILVTRSKKLIRNRERLIVSWNKQRKLSAKTGQLDFGSELKGLGNNLTKAQKEYSQSLIRVHINQQLAQSIQSK